MSEDPASPQFRSRQNMPAGKRVYPIAVHQAVDFNPTPQQQAVVEDTKSYNCFRCGTPMLKKDIFGTFDGHPVCKPCYLDLERAENEGSLDDDYVNSPSVEEEKAEVKKAEEADKKEDEGDGKGALGGDDKGGLFDF